MLLIKVTLLLLVNLTTTFVLVDLFGHAAVYDCLSIANNYDTSFMGNREILENLDYNCVFECLFEISEFVKINGKFYTNKNKEFPRYPYMKDCLITSNQPVNCNIISVMFQCITENVRKRKG
ncbi:uncharacterized protein LOC143193456 [Rhynchophorus ferrugineus]|uniref:uncharacterized protein LOC143193456 n=1 Tax=Rhynchophorus ferrugineus TaxID=354439 RepID=UPI003FCDABD3